MYDLVIIDPTSTEFNRGSFCYLPYILYAATKPKLKVKLVEDFTAAQIDNLPKAKQYLVSLWSYPQIELCLVLHRYLPRNSTQFFGYYPLINHLQLPIHVVPNSTILAGIKNYPMAWEDFRFLLLSDCDMHLSQYEGQVYPVFTSYGCPNGCAFCPSTINCGLKRISLSIPETEELLDNIYSQGVHNLHFTDEDFFYDPKRTFEILTHLKGKGMQLIALGSASKVLKFIDQFGTDVFRSSGLKLIEVGVETTDPELSKAMGKRAVSGHYERLAEIKDLNTNIFWLALTFFPGETIGSLNETGRFLKKYGWKPADLYGRIATNSTEGGLGQFFQPYHGTKIFGKLDGIKLTDRPMRLLPSFIPNTFLESVVEKTRPITDSDMAWLKIYNISPATVYTGKTIRRNIEAIRKENDYSVAEAATYLGICARLRIIE